MERAANVRLVEVGYECFVRHEGGSGALIGSKP